MVIDFNYLSRAVLMGLTSILAGAGLLAAEDQKVADFGVPVVISLSNSGQAANADSLSCSLSNSGDRLLFNSAASNLVSGVGNSRQQIYLRDIKAGTIELISKSSAPYNVLGDDNSSHASMSANSRYIVFDSEARHLTFDDNNNVSDVFMRDRQTGATTRISKTHANTANTGDSWNGDISADGRLVVFTSLDPNILPGDTDVYADVFLFDRGTGVTKLVSHTPSLAYGRGHSTSGMSAISADGKFVVFGSLADDLVDNDTNLRSDVFIYTVATNSVELISLPPAGESFSNVQAALAMGPGSISEDGRYVTFATGTNAAEQVYVRDRQQGKTTLVSRNAAGTAGAGPSNNGKLNANGSVFVFDSAATNLVSTQNQGGVFLVDSATGKMELLSGNGSNPCFSSNGLYIGYEAPAAGNLKQIYRVSTDACENDPEKTSPGACGCGIADTDSNQNFAADCNEAWFTAPKAPVIKRRGNARKLVLQEYPGARYELNLLRNGKKLIVKNLTKPRVGISRLKPGKYQASYTLIDEVSGPLPGISPLSPVKKFKVPRLVVQ